MGFFYDPEWLKFLMESHWDENSPRLYVVESADGKPLLLAPLQLVDIDPAVRFSRMLASIGHTENFSPLCLIFAPELTETERTDILTDLLQTFRILKPAADVLRLWPVEDKSPMAAMVKRALTDAGYWVQSYRNSFNRYEDTAGIGWDDYLASCSSNQRYNIRRRGRNLEKAGDLKIDVYSGANTPESLQKGINDYILGTVGGWQSTDSLVSQAMLSLIRLAAKKNALRLGVLTFDGQAIAGQFWIVSAGVAHCMRLAFNDEYKKLSPGVVLTAHMLEYILDTDQVDWIDFGSGDDEYKEKWMRSKRFYSGFMAFNPSTAMGLYYAAKHIVGQPVKRMIRRFIGVVLRR